MWDIFRALDRGWTPEQVHECTKIDPWFLRQFSEIVQMRQAAREETSAGFDAMTAKTLRRLKRAGFGDQEIALACDTTERAVSDKRESFELQPVYKRVDTCAAEFESFTPYMYSSYEPTCEANPSARNKVVILGSGPNRIGQGIEFRLLLLPRGLRAQGRRLRNDHGELQPGNRVDRLRHGGPVVFPAADVRRRHGDHQRRTLRRRRRLVPRAVRRPDAAEARARAAARRREDSRHVARFD